ncbi:MULTISPECIES: fumarylacetoacetate hydrolase family protein [Vibrio harveyi group]|uniref:fumarylacetoacetate hydrolase family protein n=1 Tax=Vibrio harveyi group TaxID=717610 RepID=UPI0003AA6EC7|nr:MULTISPECIES: fumarylacetoacetate hydrolase family protein [Vibrio harveyi group]PAW12397.1 fumarylacetoacetate hydrolase [Vibrio sp. V1B]
MKLIALCLGACLSVVCLAANASSTTYVRYQHLGKIGYGKLVEDSIYPLKGDIFSDSSLSSRKMSVRDVNLLLPTKPEKVFVVQAQKQLGETQANDYQFSFKLPSALISKGVPIQIPTDAKNIEYSSSLVVVIGKQSKNIDTKQASAAIFGLTVGGDLTEPNWLQHDAHSLRAKSADGFAPIANEIVRGLDFTQIHVSSKINGKAINDDALAEMTYSPAEVVSELSQYFTLKPGDLIYIDLPTHTVEVKDNDVVSVSLNGIVKVENKIMF